MVVVFLARLQKWYKLKPPTASRTGMQAM
jgi:hypothetical protein